MKRKINGVESVLTASVFCQEIERNSILAKAMKTKSRSWPGAKTAIPDDRIPESKPEGLHTVKGSKYLMKNYIGHFKYNTNFD